MEIAKKAFGVAIEKHKTQKTKIKGTPFVIHPIDAGNILISEGCDNNLIAAGFLHDTIEDTSYTLDELKKDFNEDVKNLVEFSTEDMAKSWQQRKEEMISKCKTGRKRELLLEFADKFSNLKTASNEKEEFGKEVFNNFSGSYEEIKDYYSRMYGIFKERLPNLKNLKLYNKIYERTFC